MAGIKTSVSPDAGLANAEFMRYGSASQYVY
jgi:hypothetical protein